MEENCRGRLGDCGGKIMETTSIVVVTLGGVPLTVELQWPFHANVSGADFYVLHGTVELGDGSGLHAQVALHLTRVVAERLPSIAPEHTIGPVLGAIRKETERKQLEFLRSDKRQPIPLGARFQDFRSKQWRFEQASDAEIRQALLDRLFWVGGRLRPGSLVMADPGGGAVPGNNRGKARRAGQGDCSGGVAALARRRGAGDRGSSGQARRIRGARAEGD